jgi:hypothetical protein
MYAHCLSLVVLNLEASGQAFGVCLIIITLADVESLRTRCKLDLDISIVHLIILTCVTVNRVLNRLKEH